MYVLYYSLYLYYDIIMIFFVWFLKSWKIEGLKDFVKVSRVLVNGFFLVINNINIEIVYENKVNFVYSIFFGGLILNDEWYLLSICM